MARSSRKRLSQSKEEIVEELKERFTESAEATLEQRRKSLEDLRFCDPDNQWDSAIKAQRQSEQRPCLSFDRIGQIVAQIVNAERTNKPSVQIKPVNNGADIQSAQIYEGLIRHIDVSSGADQAIDVAFESAVRCGLGWYRVSSRYEREDSFNQELFVSSIINPFSVYWDPSMKEPDGSDMDWCIISEDLTDDEYKALYPDTTLAGFSNTQWLTVGDEEPEWFTTNDGRKGVRICEYFKKVKETKLLYLYNGKGYLREDLPVDISMAEDSRETTIESIKWYKCNGLEILEETDWPGKYIPIIPVLGAALHISGKTIYSGIVRNLKSEQVHLNISTNSLIETAGMIPKAPYLIPVGGIPNGEAKDAWKNSNRVNYPYLLFNTVDEKLQPLPAPIRNFQEPAAQVLIEVINMAENSIKATSGMYDPSLGNKMNLDQSGVAIKSLQNQGAQGNYHFADNLNRALRLEGLIMLEAIPFYYDTHRTIRIIGLDNQHKTATINGEPYEDDMGNMTEEGVARIFDIANDIGKYDVSVSSGPSYQTQREQDRNMLFDLANKDPQLFAQYADIIFETLDSPAAIQLTERAKALQPPSLQNTKGKKPSLQQVLQENQQLHDTIQKLTQTLQQETQLADKTQNEIQLKLKIAEMEQATALIKQESEHNHSINLEALKGEIATIRTATENHHEMVRNVQEHHLGIERDITNTALGAQAQSQAQVEGGSETPANTAPSDSTPGLS
jgi:hypothetical protein